jgi:hypothetical protein
MLINLNKLKKFNISYNKLKIQDLDLLIQDSSILGQIFPVEEENVSLS